MQGRILGHLPSLRLLGREPVLNSVDPLVYDCDGHQISGTAARPQMKHISDSPLGGPLGDQDHGIAIGSENGEGRIGRGRMWSFRTSSPTGDGDGDVDGDDDGEGEVALWHVILPCGKVR